jgi:hypothetical protein
MPNRLAFAGAVFAAMAALLTPQGASAEGNLVVYSAVQEEWCHNMVAALERQTGIKVAMTRKSCDEFYVRCRPRPAIRAVTSGGAARATRICRRPKGFEA